VITDGCQLDRRCQASDGEAESHQDERRSSASRHFGFLTVFIGSRNVLDGNVIPSDTGSVCFDQVLREVPYFIERTLFREAEAHSSREALRIFAFTTASEINRSIIVAGDRSHNILRFCRIVEARAVVGPFSEIPSIHKRIEKTAHIREPQQVLINGLIAVQITNGYRLAQSACPSIRDFQEGLLRIEPSFLLSQSLGCLCESNWRREETGLGRAGQGRGLLRAQQEHGQSDGERQVDHIVFIEHIQMLFNLINVYLDITSRYKL